MTTPSEKAERATWERISKMDGFVSPCSLGQVRHGLESSVYDLDLALAQMEQGSEIGNNFFIYRKTKAEGRT